MSLQISFSNNLRQQSMTVPLPCSLCQTLHIPESNSQSSTLVSLHTESPTYRIQLILSVNVLQSLRSHLPVPHYLTAVYATCLVSELYLIGLSKLHIFIISMWMVLTLCSANKQLILKQNVGMVALPNQQVSWYIFTVYVRFACLMFWELHPFCAASICHGETVEVHRCRHVPILILNWLLATCKFKTIHIPVKKTINTLRPITDICLTYTRSQGGCTNVHIRQAG